MSKSKIIKLTSVALLLMLLPRRSSRKSTDQPPDKIDKKNLDDIQGLDNTQGDYENHEPIPQPHE